MNPKAHWETVYRVKPPTAVSWYAPHLVESLRYIRQTQLGVAASVIDVGGGEATLVDDLLESGYTDVTVLDLSVTALQVCRARLGERASAASWIEGDVLALPLAARRYDIWHDRAVFHFLTEPWQRELYVAQVLNALRPRGFAIVGTFGPEGPEQCSGLTVSRYDPASLHGTFGAPFELLETSTEVHTTPWGATQQFVYCFCRKGSDVPGY
jgi:SAM-dependent methyltransferase